MKQISIALLVILLFTGLKSPGTNAAASPPGTLRGPSGGQGKAPLGTPICFAKVFWNCWKEFDCTGTFVLPAKSPVRVTIDYGWKRDDRIPVSINFRGLEISSFIYAPREKFPTNTAFPGKVIQRLIEDGGPQFFIYEQNSLRTRLEFEESTVARLNIDEKGMVTFFFAGSRLNLKSPRLMLHETSGPLYRITFTGLKTSSRERLLFSPGEGIIYAISEKNHTHSSSSNVILRSNIGVSRGAAPWPPESRRRHLCLKERYCPENGELVVWAIKVEAGSENNIDREIVQ
ncbi:MAG: hypothetical protein GY757_45885 [bacterium]|nr:hypothetical protein [bacterium]